MSNATTNQDQPKVDVRALPTAAIGALLAMSKAADGRRDELTPGKHTISLVTRIEGFIRVAADTEGARSVMPEMPELVAYLLSQMSAEASTRILSELPTEYLLHGKMPPSDLLVNDLAEALLKRLRRQVPQRRRGAITAELVASPLTGMPLAC